MLVTRSLSLKSTRSSLIAMRESLIAMLYARKLWAGLQQAFIEGKEYSLRAREWIAINAGMLFINYLN